MSHTIVLVTGGYDPIHSGHIKYMQAASELGDMLIVGVNSDAWLARKKGRSFMPSSERTAIVKNLRCVDQVVPFNETTDQDNSATRFIEYILEQYPGSRVIFANGGDRTKENIPEMIIEDPRLSFEFGVGGSDKANSSSWILQEWKSPREDRQWGYYRVLHEVDDTVKVKELTVDPGKSLSMQRHEDRNELWFVGEGLATVWTLNSNKERALRGTFGKYEQLDVPANTWHQLHNDTDKPVKIIEIQYGDRCVEEDIERLDEFLKPWVR